MVQMAAKRKKLIVEKEPLVPSTTGVNVVSICNVAMWFAWSGCA